MIKSLVLPVTQAAAPTFSTDNVDVISITGAAQDFTSLTTNQTGTPSAGDSLIVEITDNGTARAIAWGSKFESSTTVTLPTTTIISTKLTTNFRWNAATSAWRIQWATGIAAPAAAASQVGILFWAGNYHRLNIEDPSVTAVMNAASADGCVFLSGRTATLTQLGCSVSVAGSTGSVLRFGLFSLSGTTATLITDFGTAVSTGTGFVSVTGTAAIVAGQQYIAVCSSQGAPTTRPTVRVTSALEMWGTQVGYTVGSALLTQVIGARVGAGGGYTGALSSGTLQASGSNNIPCIVGFCAT